ncbi:MAG TPA: hypothetical protein VMM78_01370 [Thermomicrobiales bacterium]|nr:hypothetical protein [Thermomicrobiales bacterium]
MTRRIWLGLGGGGLALALCAVLLSGAVFAQEGEDGETSRGQAFIERLAVKLGLTTEELQSAVQETQTDMVEEAVANGRITEEQAAEMRERIEEGSGGFGFMRRHHHGPFHGHGRLAMRVLSVNTIADELGISKAELRQQLAGGSTLVEVIEANGSTVDAIVAAIVEDTATRLEQAVANGRMTQEQADAFLADLPARLTERIEAGPRWPLNFELDLNDSSDDEAVETTSSI